MARVRDMQGVTTHITTLKSDGVRRHPAYCIFAEGKGKARICTCPQGLIYGKHCGSASKCDYYERREKEK